MKAWQAALVFSIAGAAAVWPDVARADTKQECLAAYDKAQTLIQSNKLVAAREQLLVCGKAACPSFVSDDCGKWLSDVDTRTPTVVIDARSPDGQDAVDVTVEVDGKPLLSKIEGRAMPLDPGEHVFRFQMSGARPIERRFVIHESVKGRHISVQFESDAATAPSAAPAATQSAPAPATVSSARESPTSKKGGVGAPVYVLGGLGLLGMASFAYFGLDYDHRLNDLDGCKPNCDVSRTDRSNVSRILAFVSAGVGVAALGTAAVMLISGSGKKRGNDAAMIDVMPLPGGAMGVFRGSL
jgi:hypothetical protein